MREGISTQHRAPALAFALLALAFAGAVGAPAATLAQEVRDAQDTAYGAASDSDLGSVPGSDPDAEERLDILPVDEELTFAQAFAPFDEPAEPDLPPTAVDITTIEPATDTARDLGAGVASYYGRRFHGRRTANGERFNMRALTAAHKTLPFGSRVRVTNTRNGRSVIVRINDRGPFIAGRHIDLSRRAAEEIGMIRSGHASVQLELLVS